MLDIAAGAGDQTLDIARRVGPAGHVLATDISPRALHIAAEKLRQAGVSSVQTCVADAQALGAALGAEGAEGAESAEGTKGATFDAAVCRLGLMFCTEPLQALRGALGALKPGGRFGALVFSAPQANPCIAVMASTALRHAGLAPKPPFEPGGLLSLGRPGLLAELLVAAGFADIDVRALAAPMRLPSVQHYIDFVRTAGLPIMAILAPLPAAAQHAAWQDIAQQLERFATPQGWEGPNELLLCSATRPAQALSQCHFDGASLAGEDASLT